MVRRVQANQASQQDYYYSGDNYYGYDQSQPQQNSQNYYHNEQEYQVEQTSYQQQQSYVQPSNNYGYTSPVVSAMPAQSSQAYGNSLDNNNSNAGNQYSYPPPTQPFLQQGKVHASPVIQSSPYGASYGIQTLSAKGSWLSAFGTGGFEGEPPLLEGRKSCFKRPLDLVIHFC